jgi:hypothetical protein
MIPRDWLTLTRVSGLAAYGVALTCSAIAWLRTRRSQAASSLAARLTMMEGLLLIDMIVDGRWMLHRALTGAAQRRHDYDLRRLPQSIGIAVLVAILFVALLYVLRTYHRRIGALLAISGVLLSLFTWCVEVVSLHAVDALLYHPVGRGMVISLVWMLACLMTAVGILIDACHPRVHANC